GQYRWVLGRAQPIRDDTGAITRWYGTCTDIQEIVDAREVLAKSRSELEHVVDERTREAERLWKHSRDLQMIVGADGIVRAANDAWTTILGWTPTEVVGRRHLDFIHADHDPLRLHAIAPALVDELPPFETCCAHKDGSDRWISWVASVEAGSIYASGRDVTAEKKASVALEATKEQLRQSQKMEAMGQLAAGLAHDFNNFLGVITASLEVMKRKVVPGADRDVDRCIAIGQNTVQKAGSLTQRLLTFARHQPLEAAPLDVNALVRDIKELVRRTMGSTIEVDVTCAEDLWQVCADTVQLESALLNLCINARDAMTGGGELTIATANVWLDQPTAQLQNLPAGPYVSISVTDTGTGMGPEVVARALDPFFTTKPVGSGTGLGLSMVYGFARESGGQIWVDSEVGRGTTMRIYLQRLER
ncbi:MAG: ATP-binding protein, partial [Pseudomonadota bacterium]|nr:ATP-binding protein [Pseudomonadota bacterium]